MFRKWFAKNINNMWSKNYIEISDEHIDILKVPNIIWNKKHPTEKPKELMQMLIENSTNEWEVVFDPFFWSWATLKAGMDLNRVVYWTEIDEEYFN